LKLFVSVLLLAASLCAQTPSHLTASAQPSAVQPSLNVVVAESNGGPPPPQTPPATMCVVGCWTLNDTIPGAYSVDITRGAASGQTQHYATMTYPAGVQTSYCWVDGNVARATQYYYKVTVCNVGGSCWPDSNEASAMTPQ